MKAVKILPRVAVLTKAAKLGPTLMDDEESQGILVPLHKLERALALSKSISRSLVTTDPLSLQASRLTQLSDMKM